MPIESKFLLSQHFSAIAAAGPIVGPILAGVMFGWLPALIWILVGSIFIGGVHDFTALVASIRHKARSIAEVVRDHMSRRAFLLFLSFVWLALVYIIVAFTDITAASFVGTQDLSVSQERARSQARRRRRRQRPDVVSGGGIATSSLLVPGAADHHGPAAALHEALAGLGDADLLLRWCWSSSGSARRFRSMWKAC